MGSRAVTALLAGFGGGYLNQKNRMKEDELRAAADKRAQESHDAMMEVINNDKAIRLAQKNAYAPRTADTGQVVDDGSGNKLFYKGAGPAPADLEAMNAEAQMRQEQQQGAQPTAAPDATNIPTLPAQNPSMADIPQGPYSTSNVGGGGPAVPAQSPVGPAAPQPASPPVAMASAKPGYGINAGTQGQITTEKPDLAALNTPEARQARMVDATMALNPEKGLALSNSVIDNKQRVQAEADRAVHRKINSFSTPEDMAKFMTDYPHDGMGGKFKASVAYNPDGTWSFAKVNEDGTTQVLPGSFDNDEDGMVKARETLAGRFGDPNRRLEFYKWDRETTRKEEHNTATEKTAGRMATAAEKRADAAMKAAEKPSANSAGQGIKLSENERKRYQADADNSRRLLVAEQGRLEKILTGPFGVNKKALQPGTQDYILAEQHRDQIKKLQSDYDTASQKLRGSATAVINSDGSSSTPAPAARPTLNDAKPAAATKGPVTIKTKAERDALAPGTSYVAPNGQTYIKQ